MTLPIITADERLKKSNYVKMVVFGPTGVGKTSQARTLDPARTLFIDGEAGTLALGDWGGDVLKVRPAAEASGAHPWQLARAIACLLCGPDPSAGPASPYSREMFEKYEQTLGPASQFDKYDTIYIDSVTEFSRQAFKYCQSQPEAISEKTGKPDTRGAYGLLGRELMGWFSQLQHIPEKNVVLVGILDVVKDPDIPGRFDLKPQIEGSKAARELPGIFDQVMTMGLFRKDEDKHVFDLDKGTERAFICTSTNPFGVPAKDRSGRLSELEAPNLSALIEKIRSAKRIDEFKTTTTVNEE